MLTRSTAMKIGGIIVILAIAIPSIVFAFVPKTPQSQTTSSSPTTIEMNMWLDGDNHGNVEGGCVVSGREGSIEILSMHHQIFNDLTRTRIHTPFRVTKYIDKASPILFQALADSENFATMTLKFYRPTSVGTIEHYYTIQLTNARIDSIEEHAMRTGGYMEEIAFSYQKISWTDEINDIIAEDDWQSPVVG